MTGLVGIFAELDGLRAVNAQSHSLHEILVIALCAVIIGGQTWYQVRGRLCTGMELYVHAKRDLLQSFLKPGNGIPSYDTFSRVLGMLDPEAFRHWFLGFMGQFAESLEGVVALDGKTLRRSYDRAAGQSPLYLVSAWATWRWDKWPLTISPTRLRQYPGCWKCRACGARRLPPTPCTANGRWLSRACPVLRHGVVERGGGYALTLKGNQDTLHDGVKR